MRIVAFIPYFGGIGPKAPSPAEKRPDYLLRTVKSLQGFADETWVGVCRPEDDVVVPQYLRGVYSMHLECDPPMIPVTLARTAQEEGFTESHDAVYVTEADQIIHYDEEILASVSGTSYLVPHRLEKLGPNRAGAGRGQVVEWEGDEYSLCERPPVPLPPPPLYTPANGIDGYGGAFLASGELFRDLDFQYNEVQPVEAITGFATYIAGDAHKARDWKRFFVEHLSGYDYHCKLGG